MGNNLSQLFPPTPAFTDKEVPDQTGKIFIVTGASSGVGEQLAQILYQKNGKVYIAARSEVKASQAIERIKTRQPDSKGALIFLHLDLEDLTTIKKSAEDFLSKEEKLDVLWNNAGIMAPPRGSVTKQGHEMQLGVNNLGPFLFTKLLTPILAKTAETTPAASVRIVWVSSSAAEMTAPIGGVEIDNLDYSKADRGALLKYGASKAGNVFHATEFARRAPAKGVISVSLNPGALKTDLLRHVTPFQKMWMSALMREPIYGAYTELFAGLSPKVTAEKNGAWIIPWGRFGILRQDLVQAQKGEADGGTGIAAKFWDWSEKQTGLYA